MIRINLLPVRQSRRQDSIKRELFIAAAGLVAMLILFAGLQIVVIAKAAQVRSQNEDLKKDVERLKAIVAEVEQMELLKADLDKKLDVIKALKANKSGPVHMLDELSQATPEKLTITLLDEEQGTVKLQGTAVSNEVISQFLSNLDRSVYFEDVYLNSIEQVETEGVKLKSFSITMRMVVPGTEEAKAAKAKKGAKEGEEGGAEAPSGAMAPGAAAPAPAAPAAAAPAAPGGGG